MNRIFIVTTKGCEGCDIAKENIETAIAQFSGTVFVQSKDWHDLDKKFIKKEQLRDFPTVIYYVDDVIVKKAVGTYPSPVYLRWMDMFFKN